MTVVVATPAASRLPRAAVGVASVALASVLGLVVGLALCAGAPSLLGQRSFAVLTGSMEPALRVGDLVVERPIAAEQARVGDVITFRDPEQPARLLTHRVRSVRLRGDTAFLVTKGDANLTVERWTIRADGRIGRVHTRIPKLGYVTTRLSGPAGRIALIVVPALLLALFEVRRLRRSPG